MTCRACTLVVGNKSVQFQRQAGRTGWLCSPWHISHPTKALLGTVQALIESSKAGEHLEEAGRSLIDAKGCTWMYQDFSISVEKVHLFKGKERPDT